MIELTPEQQQAIDAANGSPPVVIDSRTQTAYVLVRAEFFDPAKTAVPAETDDLSIPEMCEGIRRSKL